MAQELEQIFYPLNQPTHEVAVTPGHIYQIFDKNTLIDFPQAITLFTLKQVIIKRMMYQLEIVILTISGGVKYVSVFPINHGLHAYR